MLDFIYFFIKYNKFYTKYKYYEKYTFNPNDYSFTNIL